MPWYCFRGVCLLVQLLYTLRCWMWSLLKGNAFRFEVRNCYNRTLWLLRLHTPGFSNEGCLFQPFLKIMSVLLSCSKPATALQTAVSDNPRTLPVSSSLTRKRGRQTFVKLPDRNVLSIFSVSRCIFAAERSAGSKLDCQPSCLAELIT